MADPSPTLTHGATVALCEIVVVGHWIVNPAAVGVFQPETHLAIGGELIRVSRRAGDGHRVGRAVGELDFSVIGVDSVEADVDGDEERSGHGFVGLYLGAQVVAVGVVGNAIVVCVAVVDEDNLAGVCVVAGYVFAGFADAGDTGGNRAEEDGLVAVASGRVLRGVDLEFRAFVF